MQKIMTAKRFVSRSATLGGTPLKVEATAPGEEGGISTGPKPFFLLMDPLTGGSVDIGPGLQ